MWIYIEMAPLDPDPGSQHGVPKAVFRIRIDVNTYRDPADQYGS